MSRAGDYPADREVIWKLSLVCDGEYKRETFVECAGTWRASTAFRVVRTLI